MKSVIFILALFFSSFCFSQTNLFIRVYDLNNHKIAKGNLETISDSSITILQSAKKAAKEISYAKIGSIRLKRSFGHTVAMSTLITATTFGLLGTATASSVASNGLCFLCTPTDGLAAGGLGGAVVGAVFGGIIGGIRSNNIIKISSINGDFVKWQTARQQLSFAMVK